MNPFSLQEITLQGRLIGLSLHNVMGNKHKHACAHTLDEAHESKQVDLLSAFVVSSSQGHSVLTARVVLCCWYCYFFIFIFLGFLFLFFKAFLSSINVALFSCFTGLALGNIFSHSLFKKFSKEMQNDKDTSTK